VTPFEIGATLGIIGLIAGGFGLLLKPAGEPGKRDTAFESAGKIRNAADLWQKEHGRDCPTLSQLSHDGFLAADAATGDPWGGRFRLVCDGDHIVVISPGRDGALGTDDDVEFPRTRP
jgi:hypothetical protein